MDSKNSTARQLQFQTTINKEPISWYDGMAPKTRGEASSVYQCTEEMYFEQLEVVPPVEMSGSFFGVGEAHDYRSGGSVERSYFTKIAGKFYVMIGTHREATSAFALVVQGKLTEV